jgi:hypothetical protein
LIISDVLHFLSPANKQTILGEMMSAS